MSEEILDTKPDTTIEDSQENGKKPILDGDFDPERMERLVANLRAEIKEVKTKNSELKTNLEKLAELEEQLTKTQQELADKNTTIDGLKAESVKQKLLRNLGIDESYTKFLTGDNAEEWEANAKLLANLTAKPVKKTDPTIGAQDKPLSKEEQLTAEATKFFNSIL